MKVKFCLEIEFCVEVPPFLGGEGEKNFCPSLSIMQSKFMERSEAEFTVRFLEFCVMFKFHNVNKNVA